MEGVTILQVDRDCGMSAYCSFIACHEALTVQDLADFLDGEQLTGLVLAEAS